jgi:ribosomal protection tetracycline resistance protein
MSQKTLNLGILAHVDAGKTTLTERLLYAAGVIDQPGSVDAGTTQTDSLDLERQRGITIKSAVTSFPIGDVRVNLIDTPGHPDFIAEVERVLTVLDGGVLVISAVEGVQPQTRILMRTLRRLRIPTLLFVNKIDRPGADTERALQAISERLNLTIMPVGAVRSVGTRDASVRPSSAGDVAFRARLAEVVAERNDGILAAYLEDEEGVPYRRLRAELVAQTNRALVYPVFFGSAITGAGIGTLMAGIAELLPAAAGDADGPGMGSVFKIERGSSGEKIAYVRMFAGTLHSRDRLSFGVDREDSDIHRRLRAWVAVQRDSDPDQIRQFLATRRSHNGDKKGAAATDGTPHQFPPPTMESVVVARDRADRARLRVALGQLAEQDPLINLRQDDSRQETYVSLYGEVQKEVIQATLANDFGIEVTFRETTTIYIERPVGRGSAAEFLQADTHPFSATVGLRVEPAPPGSGIVFRLDVDQRDIQL